MKKVFSVSLLVLVAAFSVACDRGEKFGISDDVDVMVRLEREITDESDVILKVLASDFSLNRDNENHNDVLLMFTCPCYLGWHKLDDYSPAVEVRNQQVISVKLLPGAVYNISERRLKSGEEGSYHFLLPWKDK